MTEVILIRGTRHAVWTCQTCGVLSTCPVEVYEHQHAEGGFHHCPNGHQWGWSKATCERERLRQERDRLKQRQGMLEQEIADAYAKIAAAEAATKRLKKRAAAGVCPCCNRTFANMQRHMKTKHPNVVPLEQKSA